MPLKCFGAADEHSNRCGRKHKKYTYPKQANILGSLYPTQVFRFFRVGKTLIRAIATNVMAVGSGKLPAPIARELDWAVPEPDEISCIALRQME